MQSKRWNWKRWQKLAAEHVQDADALKLAEVWPEFARKQRGRYRSIWAHEITYAGCPLAGWGMSRVMRAANILEAAGLSSRCPGTPLYVPTMPEQAVQELRAKLGGAM